MQWTRLQQFPVLQDQNERSIEKHHEYNIMASSSLEILEFFNVPVQGRGQA